MSDLKIGMNTSPHGFDVMARTATLMRREADKKKRLLVEQDKAKAALKQEQADKDALTLDNCVAVTCKWVSTECYFADIGSASRPFPALGGLLPGRVYKVINRHQNEIRIDIDGANHAIDRSCLVPCKPKPLPTAARYFIALEDIPEEKLVKGQVYRHYSGAWVDQTNNVAAWQVHKPDGIQTAKKYNTKEKIVLDLCHGPMLENCPWVRAIGNPGDAPYIAKALTQNRVYAVLDRIYRNSHLYIKINRDDGSANEILSTYFKPIPDPGDLY